MVRKDRPTWQIETLLLDMPEEHRVICDVRGRFSLLRQAVLDWRKKNGSIRLEAFGGKPYWQYARSFGPLDEIDFSLHLGPVQKGGSRDVA